MNKIIKGFIYSQISLSLLAGKVMAQGEITDVGKIGIAKPSGFNITSVPQLVRGAVSLVMIIAAIASFGYLIWGGITWITSGGDKGKVEEARMRISAALVGLVIVAAAWAIMLMVQHFLGINIFGDTAVNLPTATGDPTGE